MSHSRQGSAVQAVEPLSAFGEHGSVRSWKDDSTGQPFCGAECACGFTCTGFATIAEALQEVDAHISGVPAGELRDDDALTLTDAGAAVLAEDVESLLARLDGEAAAAVRSITRKLAEARDAFNDGFAAGYVEGLRKRLADQADDDERGLKTAADIRPDQMEGWPVGGRGRR